MDYQPAIIGRLPGADALLTRMAATTSAARDRGVTIDYVRVAFTEAEHAAVPASNKAFHARAAAGYLREDDPATRVGPADRPRTRRHRGPQDPGRRLLHHRPGGAAARAGPGNAAHYKSPKTVTEVVEFSGKPHLLPAAPSGEEIADYVLAWALRHAHR